MSTASQTSQVASADVFRLEDFSSAKVDYSAYVYHRLCRADEFEEGGANPLRWRGRTWRLFCAGGNTVRWTIAVRTWGIPCPRAACAMAC